VAALFVRGVVVDIAFLGGGLLAGTRPWESSAAG